MQEEGLWQVLSAYPTGVYSVLILVLLGLWLLVIFGALDLDSFGPDIDIDIDLDGDIEIPGFVGLLHTLGLTGVPFTIVLTLLIFLSWVITYFVSAYLLVFFGAGLIHFLLGTVTLVGSFMLSAPVTAFLIRPLRKLSAENRAKSNRDFLGSECRVTSQTVDESFGQGKIQTGGASLIVNIRAPSPNVIKKGDIVRPISYQEQGNYYDVLTHEEFERNLNGS